MSPRRSLVVATAALIMGACAPAAQQAANNRPGLKRATVVVQNENWLEVAVYILRGSQRVRLGSVPSMGKAEFAIPSQYVLGTSDITLQADPIGALETYISPPIQVYEGARLALRIENQLRLSSFAVYATQ